LHLRQWKICRDPGGECLTRSALLAFTGTSGIATRAAQALGHAQVPSRGLWCRGMVNGEVMPPRESGGAVIVAVLSGSAIPVPRCALGVVVRKPD